MKALKSLASLFILLLAQAAWSAGTMSSTEVDPELQKGKALIENKDWPTAVEVLGSYTRTHTRSADGFNLLGYGYRHLKRYDESLAAYEKALALALDPKHRGAHEYIGVAYIELGQLDKAKAHLDALDRLCLFSCEEYRDLKRAYEAARQASTR